MKFDQIASSASVAKTAKALEANGITTHITQNAAQAKEKALSLIPEKSEVMTMTSVTLETIGLDKDINESGKYDAAKPKLYAMDRETQGREMQRLGATPQYSIGSVHAVTENGQLVIASNTGSQLPAYAYGADTAIWVVGTQKIVANLDTAMKRIYEYVLPLESERANKAYNITTGSFVSKLLIINKETNPKRAIVILVNEILGF